MIMELSKFRYDLAETSEILSISVSTILKRIEQGKLMGAYRDGRKYFIPAQSIMDYHKKLNNF